MSYPGEGVEGMYRNDIQQVAAYLDHKHADHYMIFNLSERNYNFELFHRRVVDYGWPDHHGPPLQMLINVVSAMDRWIRADPKNVAIVHCLAGRGRTGTAICAYLCYAGYFASMAKALQYYANVRSNKGKGVTQPSQLRYCKYVDIILTRNLIPKPKCVSLTRLTLTPVPTLTSQLGIRPILNIYRYAPGIQELIWTSASKNGANQEIPFFGPREGEITFDTSDMPPVTGDVMIKLFHAASWMWLGTKTEVVVRLVLNTAFLADGTGNVLSLTKRDLDIAHKDNRFAPNTQLFLYTSTIADAPPAPKTDWDPEAFNEWFAAAKQYRAKLNSENSVEGSNQASSSSSQPAAPVPLRTDPRTITFNPFHDPISSSDSPIPTNLISASKIREKEISSTSSSSAPQQQLESSNPTLSSSLANINSSKEQSGEKIEEQIEGDNTVFQVQESNQNSNEQQEDDSGRYDDEDSDTPDEDQPLDATDFEDPLKTMAKQHELESRDTNDTSEAKETSSEEVLTQDEVNQQQEE